LDLLAKDIEHASAVSLRLPCRAHLMSGTPAKPSKCNGFEFCGADPPSFLMVECAAAPWLDAEGACSGNACIANAAALLTQHFLNNPTNAVKGSGETLPLGGVLFVHKRLLRRQAASC
jgi:hypothetical protein